MKIGVDTALVIYYNEQQCEEHQTIQYPYQEWWRDRPDETTATCHRGKVPIPAATQDEEEETHFSDGFPAGFFLFPRN